MKKLYFLLFAAGLFISPVVDGQSATWIKTSDGQINCKRISVLEETTKIVSENGEKQAVPTNEVLSYFKDNTLFVKMPLFTKGIKGDKVFMEYIKTRDELMLFRYPESNNNRYLVYKGDDLYMELFSDNKQEFEEFFQVQLY